MNAYTLELASLVVKNYQEYTEKHPDMTDKEKKAYHDGLTAGANLLCDLLLKTMSDKIK